MKTLLNLITIIFFLIGCYGILWPLPMFLLSDELSYHYVRFIWNLPKDDKSAGSALPFVWLFFTAPLGFFFITISLFLFFLKK